MSLDRGCSYVDDIQKIKVTSQWRPGSLRHNSNKSIDIRIYPIELNPIYFCLIHEYLPLNLHLCLIKNMEHIHIDAAWSETGNKNMKLVELPGSGGGIRLERADYSNHESLVKALYEPRDRWYGYVMWWRAYLYFWFDRITDVTDKPKMEEPSSLRRYYNITKETLSEAATETGSVLKTGLIVFGLLAGIYIFKNIFKE